MAYAIGLVLAPLGGLIGALIIAIVLALTDQRFWTVDLLPTLSSLLLFAGPIGALFAAPTTLIALPIVQSILDEEPGPHTAGLATTGFASGALTMFMLGALTLEEDGSPLDFRILAVVVTGGLSGAACGYVLDVIMRHRGPKKRQASTS